MVCAVCVCVCWTVQGGEHGQLFLLRHLLILREQIQPFDANFAITENSLDFSRLSEAVSRILSGQFAIGRYSPTHPTARTRVVTFFFSAFQECVVRGGAAGLSAGAAQRAELQEGTQPALQHSTRARARQAADVMRDRWCPTQDLDKQIVSIAESYTSNTVRSVMEPVLTFLAQVTAASRSAASAGDAAPPPALSTLPFAQPGSPPLPARVCRACRACRACHVCRVCRVVVRAFTVYGWRLQRK